MILTEVSILLLMENYSAHLLYSFIFAACRNGVLFIDEFETAIHYSLLLEFTKFTQQLAERFNVQVFLYVTFGWTIRAF